MVVPARDQRPLRPHEGWSPGRRSGRQDQVQEVQVEPVTLHRLTTLLPADRVDRLEATAARARDVLGGRVVWHVNATASGGGVAEQLRTHLAYGNGAGVVNRWLVLDGDAAFFTITKRLHHLLHGEPGDDGPLGPAEEDHVRAVLDANGAALREHVSPGDVVVLHDPQTAGLVSLARAAGCAVVWRCHVGRDVPNERTERAWAFLRPHLEDADACVFSRAVYAPAWVDPARVWVIPPSIDPQSPKNRPLEPALLHSLLVGLGRSSDGSDPARLALPVLSSSHRIVVQVSRWDRLKDMAGVMTAFGMVEGAGLDDVHLVLAGPETSGVTDDPEGAAVLAECHEVWEGLPARTRRRTHLVSLPMADVAANALLVNALQRRADVVVQKSLVEGFGLTVAEAMWKGRPVVASRVGGIQDQIRHERDGLLVDDPRDLQAFADTVRRVLTDAPLAERLGRAARARVLDQYVGDRHLERWAALFEAMVTGDEGRTARTGPAGS